MPSPFPKDRLQPSLLDRLDDELGAAISQIGELRRRLERALTPPQMAALVALLESERLATRLPGKDELAAFAGLDEETRGLVERILDLERARQLELRRSFMISAGQLRQSVLRDLQNLFNTTGNEHERGAEHGAEIGALDGLPHVQASVLNYGIPPLAGRVRNTDDFVALARGIEVAIARFEPRVRNVKVRAEDERAGRIAALRSPVAYVVEGELWGYPFAEQLRVRTVLDLETTRLEIAGGDGSTP